VVRRDGERAAGAAGSRRIMAAHENVKAPGGLQNRAVIGLAQRGAAV